jgi:hypothetical protein
MSRIRMSPLGAAINLATMLALVAFWCWRRKKKASALESVKGFPPPQTAG